MHLAPAWPLRPDALKHAVPSSGPSALLRACSGVAGCLARCCTTAALLRAQQQRAPSAQASGGLGAPTSIACARSVWAFGKLAGWIGRAVWQSRMLGVDRSICLPVPVRRPLQRPLLPLQVFSATAGTSGSAHAARDLMTTARLCNLQSASPHPATPWRCSARPEERSWRRKNRVAPCSTLGPCLAYEARDCTRCEHLHGPVPGTSNTLSRTVTSAAAIHHTLRPTSSWWWEGKRTTQQRHCLGAQPGRWTACAACLVQ